MMQSLNFPPYPIKTESREGKLYVFDRLRRKYVVLTPEEWVRQHLVWYMIEELNYPPGLMKPEYSFKVNENPVRSDLVVFSHRGTPLLLAECKAPGIKIGNNVLLQAGRYNITVKTKWLVVTNGLTHFCCNINFKTKKTGFVDKIPFYEEIINNT